MEERDEEKRGRGGRREERNEKREKSCGAYLDPITESTMNKPSKCPKATCTSNFGKSKGGCRN